MLYSPFKAPLSEYQWYRSRELYDYAHSGQLFSMMNLLRHDNVGIADYHHGSFQNPIATTLTVYLQACSSPRSHKDALYGTQLLVRHGANMSTELNHGSNAMSLAVKFDMVEVARYLIENGGEIIQVYLFRSVEMIKLFMEKGFEIRSRSPEVCYTSLQNVTGKSTKASNLRHFLVAQGCDIDELSKEGDTALHRAVISGNTACTTDICHMGASLDIKNGDDKTPLEVAIYLYNMGGKGNSYGKIPWEVERQVVDIENKKTLEAEPSRRKTIDLVYAVLCDMEFFRENRVVDPEIADSELAKLGPDPHKLILKHLGIFRTET